MDAKKNHSIQNEVEQTMCSLDGLKNAKTDDFFYSRLTQRLENREQAESASVFSPYFSAAAAAALLLLAVNVFSILEYRDNFGSQAETREEYLEAFAQEYLHNVETVYNIYGEE